MASDFNPETQYLVLRPEYSQSATQASIRKSLYGGVMYEDVKTFDPAIAVPDEYESYYHSGFPFIFDIVDK
jgi:hypothetical protein